MFVTRKTAELMAANAALQADNDRLQCELSSVRAENEKLKAAHAGQSGSDNHQIGLHAGVDLRATVALTVLMAVMTAILKDSIKLLSEWAILPVTAVTVLGLIALGVCLYASSKGLGFKQITAEERSSLLIKIGFRKRISWNIALLLLVAQGSVYTIGVALAT